MININKEAILDILKSSRKKVSINFKLAVVIIIAGLIALGAFLVLGLIENAVTSNIASSETLKERAVDERYEELEDFIKKNNVKGSETEKLQAWLKDKRYTEFVVSDQAGDIFSGGWVSNAGGAVGTSGGTLSDAATKRIDLSKNDPDLYNRAIRFLDKGYYVYINVYIEYRWKAILDNIKMLLVALLFLVIVLVYNNRVLKRVVSLSNEVNLISAGELDREISDEEEDEIGTLANDVNAMRNSILVQINNEKAAQDANNQLITSMSHDIRTPLTSLIGYLDIIAGHKYKNEEELQRYISSCSDKAVQLKDLSDKLFQYFLVYNNQAQEKQLETLDAGILFQQFMIEHISELTEYEYQVNLENNIPENVMIATETSALQRLFDNLFSNIMKYADKDHPIEIIAGVENGKIKVVMHNHIAEVAKKVESTKIGVKTCKKIVEDLSGTFHALEEDNIYTTEIFFDVVEAEDIKEAEDAASDALLEELVKEEVAGKNAGKDEEGDKLRKTTEDTISIVDAIERAEEKK